MSESKGYKIRKNTGTVCIILGLLLICSAMALLIYNRVEDSRAGDAADRVLADVISEIGDGTGDNGGSTSMQDSSEIAQTADPVVEVDENGYIGYLKIPVLGLELPVMSEWSYPNLKIAPCRYSGSLLTYNLVVCAHNYDRHFGRLKTLSAGDQVTFTGADGKVREYQVASIETLEPTAVQYMKESSYELTLYTCTYGGASRVTVRCKQVNMTAEETAREKAVRDAAEREKAEAEAKESAAEEEAQTQIPLDVFSD